MPIKNLTERRIRLAVTSLHKGGNIRAITRNAVARELDTYSTAIENCLIESTGSGFYAWVKQNFLVSDSAAKTIVTKDIEKTVSCGVEIALQSGLIGLTQANAAMRAKLLPQRVQYIIGSNDKLRSLVWARIFAESKRSMKQNNSMWEPDINAARVLMMGFAVGLKPAVTALNHDTKQKIGKQILLASVSAVYFSTAIVVSE